MKPELLTLRAFGAFPKEEKVDFRVLSGKHLFLIHGPTGAGKTTILDGMCFATYGESSGAERNGRTMRSDHADPGAPTEVEYDFSVGPRMFRIFRAPEQERPKRRGAGVTRSPASATLWQHTPENADGEWTVLADGWSAVTEKVREILGFDVSQFRQVILLPQGQFEKFLVSGSQAREGILETLFQTVLYRKIEDSLKAQAAELQSHVTKYREEIATLYTSAGVDSDEALRKAVVDCESAITELSGRIGILQAEETKAANDLAGARTIAARFSELEAARAALAGLVARVEEIRVLEERLTRHQKATQVKDVVALTDTRRQERAGAQKTATDATGVRQRAEETRGVADKVLAAEDAKTAEREQLAARRLELTALRPKVESLAAARQEKEAAERDAATQSTALTNVRAELVRIRKEFEKTQAAREKDLVLAGQKGETAKEVTRLGKVVGKVEMLTERRASAERGKGVLKENAAAVTQAEKAVQAAEKVEEALLARWRKSYAVELAKGLSEGEPCAVCGAKQHPNPAKGRSEHPGDDELEVARTAVKDAQKSLQDAREKQTKDGAKFEDLTKRITDLEEELGEDAKRAVDDVKRELTSAEKASEKAVEASTRMEAHDRNIEALKKSERELDEKVVNLDPVATAAVQRASAAAATLKQIEADVPAGFVAPGALEKAITETTSALAAMQVSHEKAKKDAADAAQAVAVALAQEKDAQRIFAVASEVLTTAEATLTGRIQAAGFVDEDAWREALLPDDVADRTDGEIQTHKKNLAAAQDRQARAAAVCEGLSAPDVAAIEAAVTKAKEALMEASGQQNTLTERVRALKSVIALVDTTMAKCKEAEDAYAVIGGLYEAASGKNAFRMSLQRYVLAATLDTVLSVASQKFLKMSDGRYVLKRKAGTGDQRYAGGLDIAVLDNYTGKERDVDTLSGGEKFLASLALALSLAEVVQNYAGGVHLESVFVDEGFGSLDEEGSLDRAMQVFSDMQEGGRLVGIISHVGELRERIDARLEVIAERNGSTTRFIV